MKFLAFSLIFSLCLTGIVQSRSHEGQARRRHGSDRRRPDSDPPPPRVEMNSFQRTMECRNGMESCAVYLVNKYGLLETYAPISIPLRVRLSGARVICEDVMQIIGCFKRRLAEPNCDEIIPRLMRDKYEELWSLGEQLCVDRIDDFAKHWHCIMSLRVVPQAIKCDPYRNGPRGSSCDNDKTLQCVMNAFEGLPECEAGSTEFIREFLPEVQRVTLNDCPPPGGRHFPNSFHQLLNIM